MSTMYGILSVAGWVWAAVVLTALAAAVVVRRARRGAAACRGFEVVTEHEIPR